MLLSALVFLCSYRFHQTVSAASLLTVLRTELGGDSEGSVSSIWLSSSTCSGSRVPSHTGMPNRRRHSDGAGLFVPDAHRCLSCSFLLYQDKGSVEEMTPSRACVCPGCCWTRRRSSAALTRIVAPVSLKGRERNKGRLSYIDSVQTHFHNVVTH